MGNQNHFKGILERLREAEQLLNMGVERGNLSSIERDIVLEKLRKSYELLLFGKADASEKITVVHELDHPAKRIPVEPVHEIPTRNTEPEVKPLPAEPKKEVKPVVAAEQTKKHSEKTVHEPKVDKTKPIEEQDLEIELDAPEVAEKGISNQPVENVEIKETSTTVKSSNEILGEKYQGRRKFRNETLSTSKKDVATKLQNKPIEDLTKSIGINDKFMFTKELFHGNAELYAKSIARLNEFTDINDAIFFIQENFSWDAKNEAANQLIELVRRKLMPGY